MKNLILFVFLVYPLFGFGQQKISIRNVDKQNVVNHMVFDNTESYIPIEMAKQLLHDTLKLLPEDELILINELWASR